MRKILEVSLKHKDGFNYFSEGFPVVVVVVVLGAQTGLMLELIDTIVN